VWEERFQPEYGCLRNEVLKALDAYLNCGILAHGCARASCEKCSHSILIAFSCKKRGICPSCNTKRAVLFAEHLRESVLKPVPNRHVVFSVPKIIRPYFKYSRKNATVLFNAAWETVRELYQAALPHTTPGLILTLQTAGSSLNFNPHLHGIATAGAFSAGGSFAPLPYLSQEKAALVFAHKVLSAMRDAELIDQAVIDNIMSWRHSGFSVWAGEPIMPEQYDAQAFVARYIDRGPVANNRIVIDHDIVTYLTDDGITHEFDALEFLARVTPHIPNRWESTTRYYGVYSSRTRGELKKQEPQALVILPALEKKPASRTWAALIKKIYEVDPLICPKCRGPMKIKAFITDSTQINRLLQNLNISAFSKPLPIPRPEPPEASQNYAFS
jgi:hypothetical protein